MNDDELLLRAQLFQAANDPAQSAARAAALGALTEGFAALAESTRTGLWFFTMSGIKTDEMPELRDGHLRALSLLSGTAAALISGVETLLESKNAYAAAALNRQLVEVEYLGWAFENQPSEVVDWYSSSKESRRKRWQPGHIRQRSAGRFRGQDYWIHCETGGHPTPEGMSSLLHGDVAGLGAILRSETINHGHSAWQYVLAALVGLCQRHNVDPMLLVPDAQATQVREALTEWGRIETMRDTWSEFKNPA